MVKALFQEEQKGQLPKVTSPEVKLFWMEMTSPEAALTGNDVSHVRRMRNRFPRFFLTIVVVQIEHHRYAYRMWRHVTQKGFPLEGCAHAQPQVAQYPPYWGL